MLLFGHASTTPNTYRPQHTISSPHNTTFLPQTGSLSLGDSDRWQHLLVWLAKQVSRSHDKRTWAVTVPSVNGDWGSTI